MTQQLKVYASGKGRPVIFLHGIISTHRYWDDVLTALQSNSVRAIRPDLLGFGNSPKPRRADYSIKTQIEWLESSLGEYLQEKPILVGHSLGAILALEWAAKKPQVFSSLVLTSIPMLDEATLKKQVISMSKNEPRLQVIRSDSLAFTALTYSSYIPKRLAASLIKTVPRHVAEDTTRHKRHALTRIIRQASFSDDVTKLLKNVSVRTDILTSSKDPISNVQLIDNAAKENHKINADQLSCSHQIPIDKPDMVAKLIRGIIGDND